jgi:peroxiredoxin Q/BCP
MALQPGDNAPDFCLPNNLKTSTCLEEMRGKWVVLYFYPRDNTPGCTLEAVDFSASLEEFRSMNTEILGISADSVERHCKFVEKHGLTITLLSDEDHHVLETYGAWREKKMYGRSFMGIVRSSSLIDPMGKIVHIWPMVRARGHVDDVMVVLRELQGD